MIRIWTGYGSEHSANLVMIGRFKDVGTAEKAKQALDKLAEHATAEWDALQASARFSDQTFALLRELGLYSLGAGEIEQFAYDVHVERKGEQLVITTDEIDIAGFLKVLIDKGAKIEIYSRHDFPGDKQPD